MISQDFIDVYKRQVYNRVNNIAEVTAELQRLLPDAKVAFAHGQMKERELEEIMMGFMNHEIDVLVSTTIIETGLDIPNVNTMIIHDANQLGLSQLYQLRGRVGRSNRNAFAFLMYKKNTLLKETAEKRLQAIREFTEMCIRDSITTIQMHLIQVDIEIQQSIQKERQQQEQTIITHMEIHYLSY